MRKAILKLEARPTERLIIDALAANLLDRTNEHHRMVRAWIYEVLEERLSPIQFDNIFFN